MFVGTWWSLMPPIIAILLALLTKEVYLSLFAGCALGALLVAEFHPWVAFDTLFNTMIDSVDFSILMFMILLGMVVMLMQESGGTRAYGEWAAKKLKSKRATLVATSLLGALTFCGRLLQLPDRGLRHAPGYRQVQGFPRQAGLPHRRHGGPGLHHCADLVLGGGGQLLRPGGQFDVRL